MSSLSGTPRPAPYELVPPPYLMTVLARALVGALRAEESKNIPPQPPGKGSADPSAPVSSPSKSSFREVKVMGSRVVPVALSPPRMYKSVVLPPSLTVTPGLIVMVAPAETIKSLRIE